MRRGILVLALLLAAPGCDVFSGPGQGQVAPARPEHPRARGPVETVARGVIDGVSWRLTAYRSGAGLCVDLYLEQNAGGGCGFGGIGARDLALHGSGWSGELPDFAQVDGEVSPEVEELILRSGALEEVIEVHRSDAFDKTFFVAFIPLGDDAVLIARDKDGDELDRHGFTAKELKP